MNLLLLLLFVVMLVIGIVKEEYRNSTFWFQTLVGAAVLVYSGLALSERNLLIVGFGVAVVVCAAILITRKQPAEKP